MESTKIIQVPVINKTDALFNRDHSNPLVVQTTLNPEFERLIQTESYLVTAKTDGTCAIILKTGENSYCLMRRQDIKQKNPKFKEVMDNGKIVHFFGVKCFLSQVQRGCNKVDHREPLYIFNLDPEDKPELEHDHCIGFTPLLANFGEDKHVLSAIVGTNGTPGMKLWTTVFTGSCDIDVRCLEVSEIMGDKTMMTVELMGPKVVNKYGYTTNQHFVNPHGSIVFPQEVLPKFDYDSIKQWFESDSSNRWADVEGIVVHFTESGNRFKLHRGHVGLEKTWQKKKSSGLKFIFHN